MLGKPPTTGRWLLPLLVGLATACSTTLPRYHATPEQLARTVVTALDERTPEKFEGLVPTPPELRAWFRVIPDLGTPTVQQQHQILEHAQALLSGEAAEMFAETKQRAARLGVQLGKPVSITVKTQVKYFYEEADILVSYTNGAQLKLKDCVRTHKGWAFVSEVKLRERAD